MDQERWSCRGVRGAITTDPTAPAVEQATKTLLDGLVAANACKLEDIAAAIFTVPDELAGCNPSGAARKHGWSGVPLLTVREQPGDSPVHGCLRVLLLLNTTRAQNEIRHLYMGDAAVLRPDLSNMSIGAET
jgi:chorismate mutase